MPAKGEVPLNEPDVPVQDTTEARLERLEDLARKQLSTARNTYMLLLDQRNLVIQQRAEERRARHANPLVRFGRKCFSQTDEDGITLEILRRSGRLESGSFAEYGVGNGTENNTLVLAALGWRGYWVGNEDLAFDLAGTDPQRLVFLKRLITLENIVALAREAGARLGAESPDVVSLDLDGNDIYFVEALLDAGFRPSLFIVEYNARFPPPIRFQIAYNPSHVWQDDDHFGASLQSFAELFAEHGYRLVCCNVQSGTNAFFVRGDHAAAFPDVPVEIADLYAEPHYFLPTKYGHRVSTETIRRLFAP
jgi:hypothetical protein